MKPAIVVPTNRPEQIGIFLEKWKHAFANSSIYIVHDSGETWKKIDEDLGSDAFCISRQDSAIRSYGFLQALRGGHDFIVTLDDDCLPGPEMFNLATQHWDAMHFDKWQSTIDGQRVRGMPYRNMGVRKSHLNIGLWTRNIDVDSVTQLYCGTQNVDVLPRPRVAPAGVYLPMCGMNLAFDASLAPLMLFAPMGAGQPYRRFDDI